MNFIDWITQDADESKAEVLFLISGASIIGHYTVTGVLLGVALILISEYYDYRKQVNPIE